jgi:serine/threonine-protein phosphatase PP1 catalytic subunit
LRVSVAAFSETGMERCSQLYRTLLSKRRMTKNDHVKFQADDLEWLCDKSSAVLSEGPMLVEISAPVNVIGDVHGQFTDLMQFIEKGGDPETTRYLFLGDYVDRGPHSIETITLLLCLKILYPTNIFLLRGNHETRDISALYGFSDDCENMYSNEIWEKFNEVFQWLPLAAVVSKKIFCVHGGISRELHLVSDITAVKRPLEVPDSGFVADLLWADPDPEPNATGYRESERGTSFMFAKDVAHQFMDDNDLDLICRGHQVVAWGFDFPFPDDYSVVTVFSAPHYCEEYHNKAAMLKIAEDLICSFDFIEPAGSEPPKDVRAASPVAPRRAPTPRTRGVETFPKTVV